MYGPFVSKFKINTIFRIQYLYFYFFSVSDVLKGIQASKFDYLSTSLYFLEITKFRGQKVKIYIYTFVITCL